MIHFVYITPGLYQLRSDGDGVLSDGVSAVDEELFGDCYVEREPLVGVSSGRNSVFSFGGVPLNMFHHRHHKNIHQGQFSLHDSEQEKRQSIVHYL